MIYLVFLVVMCIAVLQYFIWRISSEQENFYRNLEPSRNAANAVVFAGSNTVLLRRAIEETGGFCEGTLTEDFATGLNL